MKKYILGLLSAVVIFSGCEEDDFFSPAKENNLTLENAINTANYAHGLLMNGYARIPENSWSFNDVATDDAVSNDNENNFLKMATGQWTSSNNPINQWTNSNAAIQYLNVLLSVSDSVQWAKEEKVRTLFNDRIKGEAYGLRALFMYNLLKAHAGWANGELLGVPIILEPLETGSDFNRPRDTFEACLQQIYSDLNKADELLPLDYNDVADDSQVPEKYRNLGIDRNDYNQAFGHYFKTRLTERIAKGIRAKVTLLAASPAFTSGTSVDWDDAANVAAEVIQLNGGIGGIADNGWTWYANTGEIDALGAGENPAEILWRADIGDNNDLESDHFPPTLFGDGRLNPTQNLVDAFPMANGYPISEGGANYDTANPYDGRDPRLQAYVVVNGSTAGTNASTINTAADGGTNDGLNKVETSTRTGYYMRKLLRQDVNLDPSTTTTQKHYKPRMRYTEMYLIYAEAANEAWGPRGDGGNGFSAYDVISALRERAGVGVDNGDPYLEQVSANKDEMRELIRNERRLELCFEGFRFWDLRRWEENLIEVAKGVRITNNNYETISVENRLYDPYMNYGPVPYNELLKFDSLIQNNGW